MTKIAELYGIETSNTETDWRATAQTQNCPYLNRKCLKNRKSQPELTIGTCTLYSGEGKKPVIICPFRLTERHLIFQDALPLLTLHEPGNEYRIIPEITLPRGGGPAAPALGALPGGRGTAANACVYRAQTVLGGRAHLGLAGQLPKLEQRL